MVRIDKDYVFEGPDGKASLLDLFDGRSQLIVYHFMFDPEWDKGCPGCSGYVDALGDLSMLKDCDTAFVVVSRAPLAKLEAYKARRAWSIPWYSSFESDFNYDFHVTLDENVVPVEYNYEVHPGLPPESRTPSRVRRERVPARWRPRLQHVFGTGAAVTSSWAPTTGSTSRHSDGRRTGSSHPAAATGLPKAGSIATTSTTAQRRRGGWRVLTSGRVRP